jgi:hypothetical protein
MSREGLLFEKVLAACGLASFLARDVLTRACVSAGVDPQRLTKERLSGLLPIIRKSLALFVEKKQLDRVMHSIGDLARPEAP